MSRSEDGAQADAVCGERMGFILVLLRAAHLDDIIERDKISNIDRHGVLEVLGSGIEVDDVNRTEVRQSSRSAAAAAK